MLIHTANLEEIEEVAIYPTVVLVSCNTRTTNFE